MQTRGGHGKWLVCILLLATGLRLVRLGTNSYWHDEVHNLIKAERIWDVVLRGEYVSNHPPLFPILAAIWASIGLDANEWTMRLLPALLGVITVYVVFVAGRTLFDGRAGLFAAFLTAVSPFLIAQSQDLKEYIVLPITGTLAVCALYTATMKNKVHWWAAYALCAALACYSESFAGPLLIAANLWCILNLRGRLHILPWWILANTAAFLAFLPFLLILVGRAQIMMAGHENWWVPKPSLWSVVFYLKTLSFGYSSWETPYRIALAVFIAAFCFGTLIALATRTRAAFLAVIWFAVPVAIVYGVSQVVESIFLYRALIPFAVPFYLLVSVGCTRSRTRLLPGACAVLFAMLAAPSLWHHYNRIMHESDIPHRPGTHPPQDYRGVSDHVMANWHEGDAVITAAANVWLPMYWYGLRGRPLYNGAVDESFIRHIEMGNPSTTDSDDFEYYFPKQVGSLARGHTRIWFVFTEWERKYLPGNAMSVWRWLDAHCREIEATKFNGIDLRLYDSVGSKQRVVRRNADDGVSALEYTEGVQRGYRVVVPDSGLVAAPDEARRGALRLRFVDTASEVRHNTAQTDAVREVSFSIVNTTSNAASMVVDARGSDETIAAASLSRSDPAESVWRVGAHHNPHGNPQTHELAVAAAYFNAPGSAVIAGTMSVPAGTYDSFVHALGTPSDTQHSRADFGVIIDGTDVLRRAVRNRPDRFEWAWTQGAAIVTDGDALDIQVSARHLLGAAESFADVAYVALIRQRGAPRGSVEGQVSEPWPGEIELGANETRTWTLEIDDDMPRMDVWIFERGENGRAYHIFDGALTNERPSGVAPAP